jgi:isopentenyl diphosphate isomerase/L-lactate dehydrogenase-like FMN-dependent dehydrogenase
MAPVNLAEYEAKAREILPLPVFDYYYGGAHNEITVRENCAAFPAPALHYHVLRGADRSDTTVGERGVSAVLGILSDELDLAMALCGCRSLAKITPDLVWS